MNQRLSAHEPPIDDQQQMLLPTDSQQVETDHQGYLKNPAQWTPVWAESLARQEGITLTPAHWEIISFVRTFYQQFNTSPAMRLLVKALQQRYGTDKGSSHYLYTLFPQGPAKLATKIAGLPRPVKCL